MLWHLYPTAYMSMLRQGWAIMIGQLMSGFTITISRVGTKLQRQSSGWPERENHEVLVNSPTGGFEHRGTGEQSKGSQPDIVVDEHQKTVVEIDVAIPSDSNIRKNMRSSYQDRETVGYEGNSGTSSDGGTRGSDPKTERIISSRDQEQRQRPVSKREQS